MYMASTGSPIDSIEESLSAFVRNNSASDVDHEKKSHPSEQHTDNSDKW